MIKKITSFFVFSFLLGASTSAAIKPNDSFYGNQWYLSRIEAGSAWEKNSVSPDIVIAVIDSGIDINHPDIKNNIWENKKEISGNGIDNDNNGFIDDKYGWDFVNNVPDPSPKFSEGWTESGVSHGTIVAGIIAAEGNNNQGIAGITWRAQIIPLKALNDKGEGKISDIIRAIDYATNNGAHIINLSFMNFSYNASLQSAISRAHEAGVIIVAAAGNEQNGLGYDTKEKPIYPACYDGNLVGENMVIGVAATDALDQKANFSSYGDNCIDISAPGISFFSTITTRSNVKEPNLLYDGYWSGTSMAAPLVSGALALIAQANPELSKNEIVSILLASTDDISALNPSYENKLGNGRLNLNRAVEMAKNKLYSRLGTVFIIPEKEDLNFSTSLENSDKEFLPKPEIRSAAGSPIKDLPADIFQGFSSLLSYDFDKDGLEDLILGAATGYEPKIKILSFDGRLKREFLAYDKNFRGGLNVAMGDVDGDGEFDIVVAPVKDGNGKIKIFDKNGKLKKEISAYDKNFKGEVVLGVGNIDGKGADEIVIGFGSGVKSSIRILSGEGELIGAFYPYEKNYQGGIKLIVANLDGRKDGSKAEIITVPSSGREALVKVFDNFGKEKSRFLAYGKNWLGGVNLSAGDLNNDGMAEIVLGAKSGAAPHVRIFNYKGLLLESFYAWPEKFSGGVNLTAIKIKI